MQAVVYTAICGGYDTVKSWPVPDALHMVFGDGELHGPVDPCRRAKRPKVLPHNYFDADYSLWVDGSITLAEVTMADLVNNYLRYTDIAVMLHPERDCVYEEALACVKLGKDAQWLIADQVARYRELGYPEHAGLGETGIILRRHTPRIAELEETWWTEIQRGSRRDQLSFTYCAHTMGIPVTYIPGRPFHTVGPHNVPKPAYVARRNARRHQR